MQVFEALKGTAPDASLFHAVRWFNHINSFNADQRKSFAGSSAASAFIKGGAVPAKKADDDDDIDLFGDDDEEEDEEKKKLHEERIQMYAAKKGNSKCLKF